MVTDLEGVYARWFDQLGADHAILRPDFYVAATAPDGATLRGHVDDLVAALHLARAETLERVA